MTRTLLTTIFLTLFSQMAWGLTESEFSQALSVAKLDAAVLKVRDNCQSQLGAAETSRECKCAVHYADFANETAFSIQYERCLQGLAAADKGEELVKSLKDLQERIETAEKTSVDTVEPKQSIPLSLSDIDKIRSHVSKCWSPPIGVAGAETPNVDIIVRLDRDGKVLTAEVDNKMRYATDRTFRVAADEAIRTMFKCSPLPVPLDNYEQWKHFIFGFDPRFLSR